MKNSDIFGPKYRHESINNTFVTGSWHLLNINPLNGHDLESLIKLYSAIKVGDRVVLSNGKLFSEKNYPSDILTNNEKKALAELQNISYKIAVREDRYSPTAFVINPRISWITYPFHPHINSPSVLKKQPSTICYIDKPSSLGELNLNINLEVLLIVTIWCVRHQFYLDYLNMFDKQNWIGPEGESAIQGHNYLGLINPYGPCHCSSFKPYFKCCYNNDIQINKSIPNNIFENYEFWKKNVKEIEDRYFEILNDYFIN